MRIVDARGRFQDSRANSARSVVAEAREGFTRLLHGSHHFDTKAAHDGGMNIKSTRAADNSQSILSFRFPTTLSENDSAAADWRPGMGSGKTGKGKPLDAFVCARREQLLELRTAVENSMNGVARETRLEKAESSALSTHNGDAGSDACDRDLALLHLSQESDALFEIDAALQRIEAGTYGICEMSGRSIPVARLRAIPFARHTVECQARLEIQRKLAPKARPFASPFSVADEDLADQRQAELT
jgi:DnaK suppressor protein